MGVKHADDRFLDKVDIQIGECWNWLAYVSRGGYGQFMLAPGQPRAAHRYMYELAIGPIPRGLHIDHLCRNRACVNPSHLEAVTQQENNRRSRDSLAREYCKRGHLMAETRRIHGGVTRCYACFLLRQRGYASGG